MRAAHARRRRATRAQSTAPRRSGRTEAARLHSKRRRVSVSRARLEAYACGGRVAKPTLAPGEVFVMVEFDSAEDAKAGRDKLLSSGVLDRFEDKTNPKVLEEAEQVSY